MKVIIAGSRTIHLTATKLDEIVKASGFNVTAVISGCAKGADQSGEEWAKARKIDRILCPANWDAHGKSAGMKRNNTMADICDAAILLWDGKSHGTKHMAACLEFRDKPTYNWDAHAVVFLESHSRQIFGFE